MNIRWIHEVHEITAGPASLRAALAELDGQGKEVVSVVPNTGGRLMSMWGGGDVFSLMIVTRKPAPIPRTITVPRDE